VVVGGGTIGWSNTYKLLYLLLYKLCVCVKVESVARESVNPIKLGSDIASLVTHPVLAG